MLNHLATASWPWCTKRHVRLHFSDALRDVGRFRFSKVLRLFAVVGKVWRERLRGPIDVLYYPPCGPARMPFYRDLIILLMTRPAARRVVFQFHAGGFDRLPHLLTSIEQRLALRAYGDPDLAIVLLPALAREVEWIRPRQVHVVSNGVEDHPGPPRPASPDRTLRVLFVGVPTESKGVFDLLEALSLLRRKGINFRCVVVGSFVTEEAAGKVRETILQRNLEQDVVCMGELRGDDKWREYRCADVVCFPTTDMENQPLVILEAMQFRLPVVTTRWRSLPELVRDGETGFLVPPHDPEGIAGKLELLAVHPELRLRLGEAGRASYLSRYTLQRHLEQMEEVFKLAAS